MKDKKKIVFAITGSIAIYKILDCVSSLRKDGHSVHCLLTKNATKLVSPRTFAAISNNPAYYDLWESEDEIPHIELMENADFFVLAPASYNIIGKIAYGIADDLVTTCAAVCHCKKIFAPAMNVNMFENPILQRNIEILKSFDWEEIPPQESGILACGAVGAGKLAKVDDILKIINDNIHNEGLYKGKKILVTAGGTIEDIDPVRYISNRSSGKMGVSIAKEAAKMGATVTLIHAKMDVKAPSKVNSICVRSASDMLKAIENEIDKNEMLIMAAAVSDYTPQEKSEQKIKKSDGTLNLELKKTSDILEEIKNRKANKYFIGFAAESENLIDNAKDKLKRKNLDMIVANDITRKDSGFDVDTNKVSIIKKSGIVRELELMSKDEVARNILIDAINEIGGTNI